MELLSKLKTMLLLKAKMNKMINVWCLLITLCLQLGLSTGCGRAEYDIGGQCCPMCAAGNRVVKHCTEFTSTSCIPCIGNTYLDEPSGRSECFQCTHCDSTLGLRVKRACTPTSDSECEPLEGFYCIDMKNGCIATKRHSRCVPGQTISQQGTASTDTLCMDCTGDTFSDGTFTSCKAHTICISSETVYKSGTHSTDTECVISSYSLGGGAIFGIILGILVFILVPSVAVFLYKKWKEKKKKTDTSPHQETGEQSSSLVLSEQDNFSGPPV